MIPSNSISSLPERAHETLAQAIQKFIEAVDSSKKEMDEEQQINAERSRNGMQARGIECCTKGIQPASPVKLRLLRYRARMLDDT